MLYYKTCPEFLLRNKEVLLLTLNANKLTHYRFNGDSVLLTDKLDRGAYKIDLDDLSLLDKTTAFVSGESSVVDWY